MSDFLKPGPPGIPSNPDLRELVEGKRRYSPRPKRDDAKLGFRNWHERGFLPHRDEPGLTQFVTFRLADSFPASLRAEWMHMAAIENKREQQRQIQNYLDKGRGACHLRNRSIAHMVQKNLRDFSHGRYELRAWVVMPNHVHVLITIGVIAMARIVESWKKHTARLANQILGKHGAFWAPDYFDTYMRDAVHERKAIRYIENNPVKARMVTDPKDYLWSSARYRDDCGKLLV